MTGSDIKNEIPDLKYTYDDWWEGRITFGGIRYFESEEDQINNSKCPLVRWSDIRQQDVRLIKEKQKNIFFTEVDERCNKFLEIFSQLYSASNDKNQLRQGTMNDISSILKTNFSRDIDSIMFRFINKTYNLKEIDRIQFFYLHHIVKGIRHFDFIQSPNHKSGLFENPPIEIEAEVLFKLQENLKDKLLIKNTNTKYSLQEIALFHIYSKQEITFNNANTIVKQFGLSAGPKLYQHFIYLEKIANRLSYDSPTKLKNQVERISNSIEILKSRNEIAGIKLAESEIKILKDKYL